MGVVGGNKEIFNYVEGLIKDKFKTIEECAKVVDLSDLESLTDKQVDRTMEFLYSEISTENPLHQFLELSWSQMESIPLKSEKAKFLVPIVEKVKINLGIYSEYEFHIRVISYLVYREIRGGK
jgi:hypothetical protein